MKILVIEDNEQFALLLCASLREAGFKADCALSGKAGVKTALSFLPDLILLDYHLGDISGYDVGLAIRHMQATAAIPFVLLSSMAEDPLLLSGFKRLPNCKAALVKTYPLSEIIGTVKRLLNKPEL